MVFGLLSALIERFSVSRMRDFSFCCWLWQFFSKALLVTIVELMCSQNTSPEIFVIPPISLLYISVVEEEMLWGHLWHHVCNVRNYRSRSNLSRKIPKKGDTESLDWCGKYQHYREIFSDFDFFLLFF